jgi:hypothetical protein
MMSRRLWKVEKIGMHAAGGNRGEQKVHPKPPVVSGELRQHRRTVKLFGRGEPVVIEPIGVVAIPGVPVI